jgi:hypothetical protein
MNERFAKTWLAGVIHIPGAFTAFRAAIALPYGTLQSRAAAIPKRA